MIQTNSGLPRFVSTKDSKLNREVARCRAYGPPWHSSRKFRNPLNRCGSFLLRAKTLATAYELGYPMFAPEQTNGFDGQFAGFDIA
jgi:hypothetical protein